MKKSTSKGDDHSVTSASALLKNNPYVFFAVGVLAMAALLCFKTSSNVGASLSRYTVDLKMLNYELSWALTIHKPVPEIQPSFARFFPQENKTIWIPDPDSDPGSNGPIVGDILLECCGFQYVDEPKDATVLWPRYHVQLDDYMPLSIGTGQVCARLRGTSTLTDKADLHRLLVEAGRTDLQPETYVIGDSYSECRDFFVAATKVPNTIWVSKEPGSSQGEGIVINPNITDMKRRYLVDPSAPIDKIKCKDFPEEFEEFVIQKYILNPLLLKKKKMEIRTYWLLASLEPLIVLYHDGTVRLTTNDYKNDDWENAAIHITNTAQQKKANPTGYGESEKDLKWTVHQLADYLQEVGKVKDGKKWLDEKLRPYLKFLIKTAIKQAAPKLIAKKKGNTPADFGRFELFGMDVILDDNLFPWLTEIQFSPGLSMDPGFKMQLIPQIVEEIVGIVLEIDVKKRYKLPLSANTLSNVKHFEVIDVTN